MSAPAKAPKPPPIPKRRRLGTRKFDANDWARMLIAMREKPGNITHAGKATGIDRKVIREVWLHGRPKEPWGHTPMQVIIDRELEQARAKRALAERDEPAAIAGADVSVGPTVEEAQRARLDAIETRAEEGQMVRIARGNSIGLLASVLSLINISRDLAVRVENGIKKQGDDLTVAQAMSYIARITSMASSATSTAARVLEMERLMLGDPKDLAPGRVVGEADQMSDEDVVSELTRAATLLERMNQRGMSVIEGGKSPDVGLDDTVGEGPEDLDEDLEDLAELNEIEDGAVEGAEEVPPEDT